MLWRSRRKRDSDISYLRGVSAVVVEEAVVAAVRQVMEGG